MELTVSVKIHYQNTHFITSAPDIRHLPADEGIEIAFAGRSNAGKSSSLNRLTNQKSLAKTSKTPGRTQLINLFKVTEGCHIVDLPGYGFAQVPLEMKKKWQQSLGEYLQKRQCLKGLVVLMDIRHPMKDLDQQLIVWAVECGIPVQVLLTKADKLKSGARKAQILKIRNDAKEFGGDVSVGGFSSLSGIGVDILRAKLDAWFAPALAEQLVEEELEDQQQEAEEEQAKEE
jgi:GTP-binding protein